METAPFRVDAERVMVRLDELARLSEEPHRLTRRYLTQSHRQAIELVSGWMRAAGMSVHLDPLGSVIGRWDGGDRGRPALLFGSHIDTVVDAGKYDGTLGVIGAIACVEALRRDGFVPGFAVEIAAFGDEEGSRFPVALSASRALAGALDPAVFEARDAEGIVLADAMTRFGLDPAQYARAARRREDVLAYIELHIEQGPVLESENLPVGVVTAIAGATRLEVALEGAAGHAGTVPMTLRRDALAAAAECALAVETICRAREGVVGTIGRVAAEPGVVNVIPGRAVFSLDVRAAADEPRRAAVAALLAAFGTIAARRGVSLAVHPLHEAAAVACAPWLSDLLAAAVRSLGIPERRLPSGAGHDAMAVASLTDVAMLFVRCRGGISHNPAESIDVEDVATALAVLHRFVRSFPAARPGG
jgi:allantoate deiminase